MFTCLLSELTSTPCRIYATPATILVASDGVIAVSFIMWLVGAAIAMSGTAVYVELGTVRSSSV